MPHDSAPRGRLHLHVEPDLHPEIRSAEADTSRNVHGQSIDNAQDDFWGKWRVKIQEKRQEMEGAQHRERWWANFRPQVYLRGAGYGAFFAGIAGLFLHDVPGALLGVVGGAIVGEVVVVPLVLLSVLCQIWFQKRAERLERELREMELA